VLSVSKSFSNGLGLVVDVTHSLRLGALSEVRGRLNVVWSWPEGRRSVQALTEVSGTERPKAALIFNQQLNAQDATVQATAGVSQEADRHQAFESVSYRGQRAEAGVTHRLVLPSAPGSGWANALQLRLGTGVAFADGVFAWSRPVTNSFALVVPTQVLNNQWIGVNPSPQHYEGASNFWGPAVLPDLQPYVWTEVRLQAPELPVGYSLGADKHALLPTYRSGTVVRVGEEGAVFLRGTLVRQGGAPVTFSAGYCVGLSEASAVPVPFFTNRTGRFVVTGLKPDRYVIHVDDSASEIQFTLAPHQQGVVDLGKLELGATPAPEK
jgi:outer membrane usher protein